MNQMLNPVLINDFQLVIGVMSCQPQ